jgi:hypothetical protein
MKCNYKITIFLLTLAIISCDSSKKISTNKNISKYYLLYQHRGESIDTLTMEQVMAFENPKEKENMHHVLDSVIFTYKGNYVIIKKTSNYPDAWTDGEYLAFWEKSVGFFYWKSTTWRNFILLRTNNDSINQFIDVLLGNVLLDPRLFTHPGYNSNFDFIEPNLSDTLKTK